MNATETSFRLRAYDLALEAVLTAPADNIHPDELDKLRARIAYELSMGPALDPEAEPLFSLSLQCVARRLKDGGRLEQPETNTQDLDRTRQALQKILEACNDETKEYPFRIGYIESHAKHALDPEANP